MAGTYIILSHCWGIEPPLTTTVSTLESRKSSVSMSSLPKTFRDAVTITRKLGKKYLWIDSLCIIQDSQADWGFEAGRMKDYYRNAYLTVSALSSPNSHHGILNPRKPIPVAKLSQELDLYFRAEIPKKRDVFKNSILNTRAWSLQERLLSTRIVHYGHIEMYWECLTCSTQESSSVLHTTKTDPESIIVSEGEDFKRALSYINTKREAIDFWHRLVGQYSRRALTKSSDKLPAIAGIASAIQSTTLLTYVAGLWREDISGLLWFWEPTGSGGSNSARPAVYQAPTWSWASRNGSIRYLVTDGHDKSLAPAQIIDVNISLLQDDPFGELTHGSITLRARTKTVHFVHLQRVPKFGDTKSYLLLQGSDKDEGHVFYRPWLDDKNSIPFVHANGKGPDIFGEFTDIHTVRNGKFYVDDVEEESKITVLNKICTAIWISTGLSTSGKYPLWCLLAEPHETNPEQWRRIGLAWTESWHKRTWSETRDMVIV
jgi:hypothetical protein